MKIEDLHYDLNPIQVNDKNWDLEKWRKDFPMDYLRAIYILNKTNNGFVQAEVFKAIYQVTRLHIPKILYKYYSLSGDAELNDKKLQTLSNCQIYMSNIEYFNDPYDSKCFFYDPHKLTDIERLKHHGGKIIDDFSSYTRGTALTTNGIQSMPMWAHYSNNHSGFCVSYDMNENISLRANTFPVQYVEERLDITSFIRKQAETICEKVDYNIAHGIKETLLDDFSMIYIPLLLCNLKLSQWSYEKEFRCTSSRAKGMPYVNAIPKEIYIGRNCSNNNSQRLIEIARKLNINVYKMSINEFSSSCELIATEVK